MAFRLRVYLFFSVFIPLSLWGQDSTNVYLVDMDFTEEGFVFQNFRNISQNDGYNNQPFFKDNTTLLYARNNEGQTDIGVYDVTTEHTWFFNPKTEGGEYSPRPFPNTDDLAAVRLDTDGKQRLYRYHTKGNDSELIPELEVAYYTFANDSVVVASLLAGDNLDLVAYNLNNHTGTKLLSKSGRSLHLIPHSTAVSYSAKNEEGNDDLYQLDMETLESYFICQLPIGIYDYAWWDDYKIMVGSGNTLYVYDLYGDGDWQKIADFSKYPIQNITRLAISPDLKHIALVAVVKE